MENMMETRNEVIPKTDRRFAEANGRDKTSWQVEQMWDIHHQVTQRVYVGQKNVHIAKALGITKEQVSSIRNSPVVQAQLARMREEGEERALEIKDEIKKLAPKALEVLDTILESDSAPHSVKLSAAKDVLDRGGHAPPAQVNHLHGHFTSEDIDRIKQRALELGMKQQGVIDVEAQEVVPSSMVKILPKGEPKNGKKRTLPGL